MCSYIRESRARLDSRSRLSRSLVRWQQGQGREGGGGGVRGVGCGEWKKEISKWCGRPTHTTCALDNTYAPSHSFTRTHQDPLAGEQVQELELQLFRLFAEGVPQVVDFLRQLLLGLTPQQRFAAAGTQTLHLQAGWEGMLACPPIL